MEENSRTFENTGKRFINEEELRCILELEDETDDVFPENDDKSQRRVSGVSDSDDDGYAMENIENKVMKAIPTHTAQSKNVPKWTSQENLKILNLRIIVYFKLTLPVKIQLFFFCK